jgi:hypothetical protein
LGQVLALGLGQAVAGRVVVVPVEEVPVRLGRVGAVDDPLPDVPAVPGGVTRGSAHRVEVEQPDRSAGGGVVPDLHEASAA